jgi:hypothetical protein
MPSLGLTRSGFGKYYVYLTPLLDFKIRLLASRRLDIMENIYRSIDFCTAGIRSGTLALDV